MFSLLCDLIHELDRALFQRGFSPKDSIFSSLRDHWAETFQNLWDYYSNTLKAPIVWNSCVLHEDKTQIVGPSKKTRFKMITRLLLGFKLDDGCQENPPRVHIDVSVGDTVVERLELYKGCPVPTICYIQYASHIEVSSSEKCRITPIRVNIPEYVLNDIEKFLYFRHNSNLKMKRGGLVCTNPRGMPPILEESSSPDFMARKKYQWLQVIFEELMVRTWRPERLAYCLDIEETGLVVL